jgi:hypothetical protein
VIHTEPLFAKLSYKVGGADRDRTDDLRLAKPALSQLSYSPDRFPTPDLIAQLIYDRFNDQSLTSLRHRQRLIVARNWMEVRG